MSETIYGRTEMLIGKDGVDRLKKSRVVIFGLGGVGGYIFECLCRAGVGKIGVVDNDSVSQSNLNRQLLATLDNIGEKKTEAALKRGRLLNPDCVVKTYDAFYCAESADSVDLREYDYIIDAIDTVSAKLELISRAKSLDIDIISCMGTGNKLGAEFVISDIYKTSVCPLAKVMRKELKQRGINSLKVVYSKEPPVLCAQNLSENGRHIPGSISFAPAAAGVTVAGEVIRELLKIR